MNEAELKLLYDMGSNYQATGELPGVHFYPRKNPTLLNHQKSESIRINSS
jgi:hypothetical protein